MQEHPSGQQWVIACGGHEATVVEVGGGLRDYRVGGVDVLAGYPVTEMCRSGRGQVLAPWPNRVRDGRYTFDGRPQQLALTEPSRGHASHGLVRWAAWSLVERTATELTVGMRLHPQPGWPGTLDLTMTYSLGVAGLSVLATATNVGDRAVPFGFGAHPYVALGDAPLEDVVVRVPARERLLVDDRLIPTDLVPVTEQGPDLRAAAPLGGTTLDSAFTGVERDADDRWRVVVAAPGRPEVAVWGDGSFDWVQVFTGNAEPGGEGERGIAVEPMTCPADAFTSGRGLVVLEPGRQWSGRWGVEVG
ncbi:MAG TPA: aldose 1-epimerase family protein [Pedococcus sp.]|jgi:aldose 1-epimerase